MTKEKTKQKHKEDLERLKAFRLMDDDFMTACFDGHPECVQLILRIIMETRMDFDDLPETFVIFITENDVLGEGRPLYHIERCIMESGRTFGDEAHIIYVNGEYRGDDSLGRLMEDFHCTEPSKMYYNELKERVSYFKETKEGAAIMCKAIEELVAKEREEGRLEGRIEGQQEQLFLQISKKIKKGKSLEQITDELEENIEVILPLYQKVLAEQ